MWLTTNEGIVMENLLYLFVGLLELVVFIASCFLMVWLVQIIGFVIRRLTPARMLSLLHHLFSFTDKVLSSDKLGAYCMLILILLFVCILGRATLGNL